MAMVREFVRAQLAGFRERQQERDTLRGLNRLVRKIYAAKRDGSLKTLPWAIEWMNQEGAPFWVEDQYRVKLLYAGGICLAFRPDGGFDGFHKFGPPPVVPKDPRQRELFDGCTF